MDRLPQALRQTSRRTIYPVLHETNSLYYVLLPRHHFSTSLRSRHQLPLPAKLRSLAAFTNLKVYDAVSTAAVVIGAFIVYAFTVNQQSLARAHLEVPLVWSITLDRGQVSLLLPPLHNELVSATVQPVRSRCHQSTQEGQHCVIR